MTLEEVLANPRMNPYFPSPFLTFVSSDNPVTPRELVHVVRPELPRKREALASRPVKPGQSGTYGDWSVVYYEETSRSAISLEDALARYDGTSH